MILSVQVLKIYRKIIKRLNGFKFLRIITREEKKKNNIIRTRNIIITYLYIIIPTSGS